MNTRIGNQTPTTSIVLPYEHTYGEKAIELYNSSNRKARQWQELLLYDILAYNDDGLWTHTRFGWEIPRRNGKGEIIIMREIYGIVNGERILHTAHRTTTSHNAWERLCTLLDDIGIEYKATKQMGLETIKLENGGYCNFRTRSSKGGLGEGYDTVIIDEAQEYTVDQESALKYIVTDSRNPQTLFCGTPPTAVSSGTVFTKMRDDILENGGRNSGWAEWSVEYLSDPNDKELWYMTNPSLGLQFTERAIEDEITSDEIDFNIQRLGLWIKYNQKSAISETQWKALKIDKQPRFIGKLSIGIKYGHDNKNAALSIAVKTSDGRIYVESIDCRPISAGNDWIIYFVRQCDYERIIIDGANGQDLLEKDLIDSGIKGSMIYKPKVKDVIVANVQFEQMLFKKQICHNDQLSLTKVISNCEKRAIGTSGGFGYRSQIEESDISLMESMIFALWSCSQKKKEQKQKIYY